MLNNNILKQFQPIITYLASLWFADFEDKDFVLQETLLTAFVHKSYASDFVPALSHNERLEFLWDSILWWSIWSLLYKNYPQRSEAQMTLYKIALVREENLAKVARDIDLWKYLFLSKGEERQWWKEKDAILADSLEALIGARYIIHGFDSVSRFIESYIRPNLIVLMETDCKSYKSLIQERAQGLWLPIPFYDTTEQRENWEVSFVSQLFIGDTLYGIGIGKNKKKSQEQAAQVAYSHREEVLQSIAPATIEE